MSDIDFDELDRAVNSLMQSKTETAATQPPADQPAPSQPAPRAEAPSVQPNLTVKRRGQFMDVMHASSDMKQADPAPRLAPRRAGVTLQPSQESQTKPTPTPKPPASEPVVDPLVSKVPTAPKPEPKPVPEQPATARPSTELDQLGDEPLSTPFLPDAKVDKRPLGGLQTDADLSSQATVEPEASLAKPEANTDSTVLPAELQQDVLAVESDAATPADETKTSQPETLASEPASRSSATAAPAVAIANTTSLPQSPPVMPVNDESDDEADSSIFDTEQYQPPIKHPVKRKRSWPVVLAIVLLVLLGTGGGIVFYLVSNGY